MKPTVTLPLEFKLTHSNVYKYVQVDGMYEPKKYAIEQGCPVVLFTARTTLIGDRDRDVRPGWVKLFKGKKLTWQCNAQFFMAHFRRIA